MKSGMLRLAKGSHSDHDGLAMFVRPGQVKVGAQWVPGCWQGEHPSARSWLFAKYLFPEDGLESAQPLSLPGCVMKSVMSKSVHVDAEGPSKS